MKIPKSRWVTASAWALGILVGLIVLHVTWALLVYPPQYVYRVLAWRESDVFDWQKFPERPLEAAPAPFYFDENPSGRVPTLFARLVGVDDWDAWLESNGTQAFIVIQDGAVLDEKYFNGTKRDSIVTSFSVAKSVTSALVGIAIEQGYINSVDDPITDYLPELARRDQRFGDIIIRHLLLMSSGLEYQAMRWALFNGDDPLTYNYPDQRQIALGNTHIVDPPAVYFEYNKYHPQLLGLILERTTGISVTEYLQAVLWNPLGMEFDGSWSIDSESSGFEKMETGLNARAIDFAKFGQLFLNKGNWQGEQLIPADWIAESTEPYLPADYAAYYPSFFAEIPGQAYYTYMWWGMQRDGDRYDFAAVGDKGQFIYVSPHKNLVIVRNGIEFGISMEEWLTLFFRFATEL